MRDLSDIIDRLKVLLPEAAMELENVRTSIPYTAPEAMLFRWQQVQEILINECPWHHDKFYQVHEIFVGTPHPDAPKVEE